MFTFPKMENLVKIISLLHFHFLYWWLFSFSGSSMSSFNCQGGTRGGISTIECTENTVTSQYECQDPANPLAEAYGCELDAASATSRHYCCPQYCLDGTTLIYYREVTETGGQRRAATPRCQQQGVCPTNPSEICYQPNPTVDGIWFCCPQRNVVPGGTPPGNTGTGNLGGIGGQQNCADLAGNDCLQKDYLCNNTLYFDLMSWQCASTCNRCPSDGSAATRPPNIANPPLPNQNCKDLLDCSSWAQNGFCQNGFYSNDTKATLCPLSCNLGCANLATALPVAIS